LTSSSDDTVSEERKEKINKNTMTQTEKKK